jgi:hypothetical protein
MTGLDLIRFQSKIFFETIAPYSGVINHLCNYVCGDKGAKIYASSKDDPKAAQEISDYLENWLEKIDFQTKLRGTCNNLLVQGEAILRRWEDSNITITDPSWLRGPHNEIGQNPWSYGILSPNYPFEIDTIGAYHLWYPSNEHETLSPEVIFHSKLDSSVGPSAKRSVPLCYRIRPLLPLLENLLLAMGDGEGKRQKIAGVVTYDAARPQDLPRKGFDSPFAGSLIDLLNEAPLEKMYDTKSGFYEISKGQQYNAPPSSSQSKSACEAYDKIATVAANATGVASWMWGSDFKDASYATSLTASEPTVKTGKNLQRNLIDLWKRVAKAEVIYNSINSFPVDIFDNTDMRIHIELPDVEVRDMELLYDRLSKQLHDNLLAPQAVCSQMGDDFEEQIELINIAKASGWELPQDKQENNDKEEKGSKNNSKENK